MARTPRRPASPPPQPPAGASERERIVEAFMALLGEQPIEEVGFGDIAARAGVSLADLRTMFGSKLAILAAYSKEIDRLVLAGIDADMAEEPPRERLFDVLMRRLDALSAHKAAVRSLIHSAGRNPGSAVRAQRNCDAVAAMDADRRRYFGLRAARHGAGARPGLAVRLRAAHLVAR